MRGLDESYDRVRPTVETVRTDREHGSAYLSGRALEVLRDEAALLATGNDLTRYEDITAAARALVEAQPSMVALGNRVAQVLDTAGTDPAAVERAAIAAIDRARLADEQAAAALDSRVDDARVATLSRSGTVVQTLRESDPAVVLLPESRPGREGVDVAEDLADGTAVTLTSDAAFPGHLDRWDADLFVVGADAVLPDGSVRNKIGTRPAAAVASRLGIPVVVATAADKVAPTATTEIENRPGRGLYDGSATITVDNPTFEHTPASLVDEYVTDRGVLTGPEIETRASEFAEYRQAL